MKDPNLWRVIARDGVAPLTDRLEEEHPDLAKRVCDTWERGLKRFWAGQDAPRDYVLPPFGGRPFTMSRDEATDAPTVAAEPRNAMTKAMFEQPQSSWQAALKELSGYTGTPPPSPAKFMRDAVAGSRSLKPCLEELPEGAPNLGD